MAEPKTYGDFIASVGGIRDTDVQDLLKSERSEATEREWQARLSLPLTRELVLDFARRLWHCLRDFIELLEIEEAYDLSLENAHEVLREVHTKAVALGVTVEVGEIDQCLTPTEACLAHGIIQVVPSGQ